MRNSPYYDSSEFKFFAGAGFRSGPAVSDHDAVAFGDHVEYLDMNIGKPLVRSADILHRSRRSLRRPRRDVRAVIDKFRREVRLADFEVLPVYKFFKMIAHE